MSRGSSRRSLSTTSPPPRVPVHRHVARLVTRLVVDYFDYATRSGASTRRATRHAARHTARCRLLHLRRASRYLGTSRGSCGSSSTTSPTSRVRVPRHIARLVTWLVVDYLDYVACPGASARRAARLDARRAVRAPRLRLAATLALLQPRRASRLLVSRQQWLYFQYATRCSDVVFRSHRVDHSSRLVFQTSRERQSRPQQLVGINYD
jgi:hypothetical protein